MFYHIIFTTYQKIGDLFCPFIFLDFRTVWFRDTWSTPRDYKSEKSKNQFDNKAFKKYEDFTMEYIHY